MGNGRARQAGRCVSLVQVQAQAQVLLRRRGQRSTLAQVAAVSLWRERASASAGAGARGPEAGVIQPRLCLALSIVAYNKQGHAVVAPCSRSWWPQVGIPRPVYRQDCRIRFVSVDPSDYGTDLCRSERRVLGMST